MPHGKSLEVAGTSVVGGTSAGGATYGASRIGAVVVAAISTFVLGGAVLLAVSAHDAPDGVRRRALRQLSQSLGLAVPTVELVSDSQTSIAAIAVPRTAVTGRIFDADGNAVAGIAVRARSDAQPGWDWVASSGADGAFRIEGVTLGKVHVEAQDVEAGSVASAALEPGETRHAVLVFDRTIEVTGAVLDERGAPVARAAVKRVGRPGTPDRIVVADEDGRFTLRGAPQSFERLIAWAPGFETSSVALGDVGAPVLRRDVRLRAGRPLRGSVVAPSGEPVSFARVSACAGNDIEVATSDVSGAFELPATVIGCWVTAYHARFAASRGARIGDRRDLVVRLGAGGSIEGTAVDERGKPIGLFSVTIASFDPADGVPGAPTRAGETGEHLRGAFRLDDLAPGTYVLRLHADGKVDTDSTPIEVGRNRVVRGERLVLSSTESDDTPSGTEPEPVETAEGAETASTEGTDDASGSAVESADAPSPDAKKKARK